MELRQIETFLEVARRLSFTHAARILHVAQPAVSQTIAKLEANLGVTLFDRQGREVRLTEAGNRLIPYAERMLTEVAGARHEMAKLRGLAAGRVNAGVTPTFATHLLPRTLATFRARFPHVEVILREGGAGALVAMIERGAVDLGIVVMPIKEPSIVTEALFTEPLLLATASDSPIAHAANGAAIDLGVAAEEPFILYRASYHLRSATINGCRAAGFEPRVALEGGEMETVLRMVAAGLGVSLVPALAFEGTPRSGVAALPVHTPQLTRTLAVARRADRRLAPPAEAFVQVIRQIVRELFPEPHHRPSAQEIGTPEA